MVTLVVKYLWPIFRQNHFYLTLGPSISSIYFIVSGSLRLRLVFSLFSSSSCVANASLLPSFVPRE